MTVYSRPIVDTGSPVWGALSSGSALDAHMLRNSTSNRRIYDVDIITSDYRLHKSMLTKSGTSSEIAQPYCYVRVSGAPSQTTPNSAFSMLSLADTYYAKAAHQLSDLRDATDDFGDELMEDAAIDTAQEILNALQRSNYAPPELSWHGGDAVVMLWAVGDMTYAITVTDGEWGYVARRGHRQLRIEDSLKVDRFAIGDMR